MTSARSDNRRITFWLLILAQAAHSIEEYVGRLYDVFPPARVVSGLISAAALPCGGKSAPERGASDGRERHRSRAPAAMIALRAR